MATMKLFGIDVDILYVDSAALGTGDGSTPANALTSFPSVNSLNANTAYIVRRTNTHSVIAGSNSAGGNIAIMGMPKPEDDLYRLVPTEAKTAWDADIEERFIWEIPDGTTSSNSFNNSYVIIHRVDIQTVGDTNVNAGIDWRAFYFAGQNIRFTNNKMSMKGVDLMNYAATAANREMQGGLYFNGAHSIVQNCEFEFSGKRNNWTYANGYSNDGLIAMHNGRFNKISNCTFKCQSATAFRNGYFIFIGNSENWNLTVENLDMTAYYDIDGLSGSDQDESGILRAIYASSATVYEGVFRNIDWTFGGNTGSTNGWNDLGESGYVYKFDFEDFRGGVIEKITFDTESNWDSGIESNNLYGLSFRYVSAQNAVNVVSPPKLENWTFKSCIQRPTTMLYFDRTPDNVLLKNITAWTYGSSYAFETQSENSDGVSIDNADFKGRLRIPHSATRVNITNWEVSNINSPQILIDGAERNTKYGDIGTPSYDANALVVIQNATIPALQTTDMFSMSDNSQLLIENFNTTPVYNLRGMSTLMVNSEQGVTGNWRCATEDMLLKSVNVQRTGGSSYAIRGSATGPTYNPAWMGKLPFKGLVRTSAQVGAVGQRTMTLYGAYKGFITDPRPNNIFVTLDVPLGGTGTRRQVLDSRSLNMSWETDSSAWVGDSGLTVIKLVLPFDYERAEDVELRIGAYWNEPGSYFYIDPAPEFT